MFDQSPQLRQTSGQPANYPVFRQASIVTIVLALLLSGAWLTQYERHDPNQQEVASLTIATDREQPARQLPPLTIDPDSIEATAAMVYDVRTGSVLFAKEPDSVLSLASITKLMTALLVTELIEESDTIVTITSEAVAQYGYSGLRVGERISAQNLNQYSLLSSANDAAYALAYEVGEQILPGDGSTAFVDAMNVRARELELTDTRFQNPTGLDLTTVESGALGTARDVTRLMAYLATEHPELLAPTTRPSVRLDNEIGGFHDAANTNPLVNRIPNLLGSKTGFTDLAGGNLTIVFDAGFNRPIVVTVLESSFAGRFLDVEQLVDALQASLTQDSNLH